jgi:hypothetical protein
VRTGIRSKKTKQELGVRHRGEWKMVVCAKWRISDEHYEKEETLWFDWLSKDGPVAKTKP